VAVTLDSLGQRYSLLPTEVLERATTFDLQVADIAASYERYKHNRAQGNLPEIKQDILLQALERVKQQ
jgi:hypothetical protein